MFNGVLGEPEYKTETSTCVYNKNEAQFNEQGHGRVYSLSADGSQLHCGSSIYKRIQ
jgi:hypothetical protein